MYVIDIFFLELFRLTKQTDKKTRNKHKETHTFNLFIQTTCNIQNTKSLINSTTIIFEAERIIPVYFEFHFGSDFDVFFVAEPREWEIPLIEESSTISPPNDHSDSWRSADPQE